MTSSSEKGVDLKPTVTNDGGRVRAKTGGPGRQEQRHHSAISHSRVDTKPGAIMMHFSFSVPFSFGSHGSRRRFRKSKLAKKRRESETRVSNGHQVVAVVTCQCVSHDWQAQRTESVLVGKHKSCCVMKRHCHVSCQRSERLRGEAACPFRCLRTLFATVCQVSPTPRARSRGIYCQLGVCGIAGIF